jgi:hypothetical protein
VKPHLLLEGTRQARNDAREYIEYLLEHEFDVRHLLTIEVIPTAVHGLFVPPSTQPYILAVNDGGVRDTLAHELVHYEQWRDGRKVNEVGVARRAAAIVRRARERK